MLHVVFTDDGVPAWIGFEAREGSEPVDHDLMFLAAHRRTAKGTWVKRTSTCPPERQPEDLQSDAEAERTAAEAERDTALRAALSEEADPLFFKWQRDECHREDWLKAVVAVKARFPKP
jgi:hypothetical protein